jgi:hypothetical protein
MNKISAWTAVAKEIFATKHLPCVWSKEIKNFKFNVYNGGESLWVIVRWPGEAQTALRVVYSPGDNLIIEKMEEEENGICFFLQSIIGHYTAKLQFPEDDTAFIRYTTTLQPYTSLLIPWWPRDIIPLGKDGNSSGNIHIMQQGTRSGLLYMNMTEPETGAIFYFQNLTALNNYFSDTETSAADVVSGEWHECGFSLPSTKKPLQALKKYIISDAFVILSTEMPANDFDRAKQFLNLLAAVYVHLPKPETKYYDWPSIVQKTLHDITNNSGCWSHVKGKSYLNAYVSDYATPPEIMVQLAVLLPLLDYVQWSKKDVPLVKNIESVLTEFYDDKVKCIARWLPSEEKKLNGKEEHKKPRVMDSWYLFHPLLNFSRMALEDKNETARKLFLDSLDYVIKGAHHFKYKWPVFYNMDTFEVIKAETKPGEGGEKDVAGLYAHIMMQAWDITKEQRYLEEAKKAALTLSNYGFKLFYQANNTSFAAGTMLRLWKETREEIYLNLSYLCLANIFKNVALWDCKYGYGEYYSTFFSVFPLDDAPYTAVYEEQEVFSAFHYFLANADDEKILPSVSLLLSEFIRFIPSRCSSYYPCLLPKKVLSDKQQSGELDAQLWIPVEDLQDGWKKSCQVGQEVYGAGFAFSLLSSHYFAIPEGFMIFIDYPTADFQYKKGCVSFTVQGDDKMMCRLLIIPSKEKKLPDITVAVSRNKRDWQPVEGNILSNRHREYFLHGNQKVSLKWKDMKQSAKKEAGMLKEN